jgi:RNA polymerase sigma-70 factor (ECF subfamily)
MVGTWNETRIVSVLGSAATAGGRDECRARTAEAALACRSDTQPVSESGRPEPSSEQLAEKSQNGCRESFEALVERHGQRVFNFLWQLTRNRHDAEDLTQETFLKAFRNIQRYNPACSFASWLFVIAKRTGLSHFRSARPTEELPEESEADALDPLAVLQEKEEKNSLWRLARRLKPNQREALWLRYGEGFSIAETARVMNTNQIRVKVLLHRARKALARLLPLRDPKTRRDPMV